MAPSPEDGMPGPSTSSGNMQVAPFAGSQPQGTISLAVLIDFIVQKTYHELTVLAELLPRKHDLEKKKEIAEFASRTRQLFVRLLGLVRWASSASKVEKCSNIMNFLDRQSMIFVETADALSRMARETLVHARLPNFHVPAAVEVLTTGTYGKLPACIKDKIIPPDPITAGELKITLKRLNQVIEHRLISANMPERMRELTIENGRVTFIVDSEFQVSLTVMGDSPSIPWRLLEVSILVEDRENSRGKKLVDKHQTAFIHQTVQSRLYDNSQPLVELYSCLHAFCLSLQLEVLFNQVRYLCDYRLGRFIRSAPDADYIPGKQLSIHYWLDTKDNNGKDTPHILTLQIDPNDPQMPLLITHVPPVSSKSYSLLDRVAKASDLSVEKLLMHTIQTRAKSRLSDLKNLLQEHLGGEIECLLRGTPPVLNVPLLAPYMVSEQLMMTVDTYSGQLQAYIPQQDAPKNLTTDFINHFQAGDWEKTEAALAELRFCVIQRRCEKTLQHLPVSLHDKLPLLFSLEQKRHRLGKHRVLVKFHKYTNNVLVLDFKDVRGAKVDYSVHMLSVRNVSIDSTQDSAPSSTQMYLKVTGMAELDPFIMTHSTGVDIVNELGKRLSDVDLPHAKRQKGPAYILENLSHFVALCDERVPFVNLCSELSKKNIPHQGVQVEPPGFNLVLRLLHLPDLPVVSKSVLTDLRKRLLSASMRLLKGARNWMLEMVFKGRPVVTQNAHEQGARSPVLLSYDASDEASKIVETIVTDWTHIVRMYRLAYDLGQFVQKNPNSNDIVIKSFNYRRLIILYGPKKSCSVTITWRQPTQSYVINFGCSAKKLTNPHHMVKDCIESDFTKNSDIGALVRLLVETYEPLSSLAKLHSVPYLSRNGSSVPFTLMVQSVNHVRLAYSATYCLDVRFLPGQLVSIRDGAYSCFDRSKPVEEFTPTQCLKSFLLKFVDERRASYDRRSQSEDDNPPSPMAVSTDSPMTLSQAIKGSPSQKGGFGHNPASPHSSNLYYGSSPAASAFTLSSPPAVNLPAPSPVDAVAPSPALLSQPSPGHYGQSPAVPFMGQDHFSPFPVSSPAASPWPQSPGVPRPSPAARIGQSPAGAQPSPSDHKSRVLPLRSWAGAVPTLLSLDAFDVLCSPTDDGNGSYSPLERFLNLIHVRKHWHRILQAEDSLTLVPSNEPGAIVFQSQTLWGRMVLEPNQYPTIQMKLQAAPDYKDHWSLEDVQTLEEFFNTRVVTNPARPSSLQAFGKLLLLTTKILRDMIQIMKLEVIPGALDPSQFRYSVSMSMTIPPGSLPILPPGQPAVIVAKMKLLFFIALKELQPSREDGALQTVLLPIVHDLSTNTTQVADKRDPNISQPLYTMAISQLKRFSEYGFNQLGLGPNDCSIFPAVRDLLMNLGLEIAPMQQMGMGQPMMIQQGMGNQGMMQGQVNMQPMYGQQQQNSMGMGQQGFM